MSSQQPTNDANTTPGPRRSDGRSNFRFTIAGLMLVMLIISVMSAAGSLLWQARTQGASTMMIFMPFVLIAPMGLMVIVSLIRAILLWANRRRP